MIASRKRLRFSSRQFSLLCQERVDVDNKSTISSRPKSSARLIGVTVAGMPILTVVSQPAPSSADTISVLPVGKTEKERA